ncbi:MAG: hypothetical protein ACU0C9_03285, partial [Paracoccaceae bacterium]
VMAFAPIALFVVLGYSIGTSILLGQALVAVAFFPAVWWVAYSRLRGIVPYLFGLIIFVLITALVHGEAETNISISMHYNRWAWAAAFVAILAVVLPPKQPHHPRIDGIVIGLAMSFMLLTKVTYFAAFAVPVAIVLLARGAKGTFLSAIFTGLAIVAIVTFIAGLDFWPAYLQDILTVVLSDNRPNPGVKFGSVVGTPAYLGASLVLISAVIFVRQSQQSVGGLALLLLMPAFFYVTYQNFANDPQWLLLLGVLLLALVPDRDIRNGAGWEMRSVLKMTAAVAFALAAPSFFNLAYSPFRHLNVDVAKQSQMLPRATVHSDIYTASQRVARTNIQIPLDATGVGFEAFDELSGRDAPAVFKGETLPDCELMMGLPAWIDVTAADLENAGSAAGKSIFTADLFSNYWMFGTVVPLKGGAPWYYGGLPGIENADYLLIPLCPVVPSIRKDILERIEAENLEFREIRRTSLYILFVPSDV